MNTAVTKWLVEEVDEDKNKTYSQEFDSYDEANDVYLELKNRNEHTTVSMTPLNKRLILG
jgi:hypothetical protein